MSIRALITVSYITDTVTTKYKYGRKHLLRSAVACLVRQSPSNDKQIEPFHIRPHLQILVMMS